MCVGLGKTDRCSYPDGYYSDTLENVQPLHYYDFMPVIRRFAFCVVRINIRDHAPPHFHVVMNDGREAWVKIDTTEIIHGKVAAREIAEVIDWAQANRAALAAKFKELQQ